MWKMASKHSGTSGWLARFFLKSRTSNSVAIWIMHGKRMRSFKLSLCLCCWRTCVMVSVLFWFSGVDHQLTEALFAFVWSILFEDVCKSRYKQLPLPLSRPAQLVDHGKNRILGSVFASKTQPQTASEFNALHGLEQFTPHLCSSVYGSLSSQWMPGLLSVFVKTSLAANWAWEVNSLNKPGNHWCLRGLAAMNWAADVWEMLTLAKLESIKINWCSIMKFSRKKWSHPVFPWGRRKSNMAKRALCSHHDFWWRVTMLVANLMIVFVLQRSPARQLLHDNGCATVVFGFTSAEVPQWMNNLLTSGWHRPFTLPQWFSFESNVPCCMNNLMKDQVAFRLDLLWLVHRRVQRLHHLPVFISDNHRGTSATAQPLFTLTLNTTNICQSSVPTITEELKLPGNLSSRWRPTRRTHVWKSCCTFC